MAAMDDADRQVEQPAHGGAIVVPVRAPHVVDQRVVIDRVAGKQQAVALVEEPDRAEGMAGQMQHGEAAVAEIDRRRLRRGCASAARARCGSPPPSSRHAAAPTPARRARGTRRRRSSGRPSSRRPRPRGAVRRARRIHAASRHGRHGCGWRPPAPACPASDRASAASGASPMPASTTRSRSRPLR